MGASRKNDGVGHACGLRQHDPSQGRAAWRGDRHKKSDYTRTGLRGWPAWLFAASGGVISGSGLRHPGAAWDRVRAISRHPGCRPWCRLTRKTHTKMRSVPPTRTVRAMVVRCQLQPLPPVTRRAALARRAPPVPQKHCGPRSSVGGVPGSTDPVPSKNGTGFRASSQDKPCRSHPGMPPAGDQHDTG